MLPLPYLSANLRWYFQFTVVKNVMEMQVGANAWYMTNWYMPAYNPATGAFPEGGVQAQTRQSLANAKAILEAAGLDLSHVVKTTVFLADMDDFAAMNGVYAEFFGEPFPARSAVAVKTLPKNARVEIECIAAR